MITEYISTDSIAIDENRPWKTVANLDDTICSLISELGEDYEINNGVAIHSIATIGHNVTIKAPAIIGHECFVGSNSCLRNGILLARGAKVGISCEIKTSIMLENSAVAHFNFAGDSIIGREVNIEAGAIVANLWRFRLNSSIECQGANSLIIKPKSFKD